MSHSHDLFCIDGCGTKLGSVMLPDGVAFKGNDHYGLMVPEHQKLKVEADKEVSELKGDPDFDAKVLASLQRIKAEDPEVLVLVDDDKNEGTPPVWKRVWNAIFR